MPRFQIAVAAVVAASLSFAVSSWGQERGPEKKEGAPGATGAMPTPTPSKELESFMKPIEGTWKCETKMMAGSMGPSSPEATVKSTAKFARDKDSNGMWYRGEYSMPASKGAPPMSGQMMIGYDDTAKQLKVLSWDNMGSASMGVGTMTADTLTWSGESTMPMGQKMKFRDTLTKTGPKTVTHRVEADQGKGFQLMAEDTCTKGGVS
jgi:hypothetical protein